MDCYPRLMFSFTDAASALVRCLPGEDATNGFFVSCFVRDQNITLKRKQDLASEMESNPRKGKKKRRKKTEQLNAQVLV